ncbi:hypothetical protein PoB_004858600 [Plakobranchus ocellatus]|uniref:Uncharacterized protein n=1 Tax=Plakobranchus ocellatus TaxID=259542 RepID=A0AAV4BSM6_9GAST|nr:hypothetical protein PoB_004858600 [Plakobranchus ocellatus]
MADPWGFLYMGGPAGTHTTGLSLLTQYRLTALRPPTLVPGCLINIRGRDNTCIRTSITLDCRTAGHADHATSNGPRYL